MDQVRGCYDSVLFAVSHGDLLCRDWPAQIFAIKCKESSLKEPISDLRKSIAYTKIMSSDNNITSLFYSQIIVYFVYCNLHFKLKIKLKI